MDERRLRRDGRLGDDFSGPGFPSQSDGDDAREDWNTFRDRVDQEWRSRRAAVGEPEVPPAQDPSTWLHPTETTSGGGPADFSVNEFRQRLLGGPSSELFGGAGGSGPLYDSRDLYDSREFAAFSADIEAAHAEAASIDPLAAALPQQAKQEYVDERFEDPEPGSGLVRPYFRTRGRTKPTYDLAIEALVSTSEHGRILDRVRVPEHRSICDLCLDTRSVAEVAALLRLPLGVVRVLIGDVAGLGLVLVHTGSATVGDRPSIEFMERVLSGLRRI
ncbi:Protein of unknown function [Amycolatopsis xylanica]|uniref:DUF742 domain-containing protein n=1 Tax=Amycolatopsis xylanica TaxID=589385 RepID=A0A1H2YJD7_9PSEU|nr:DUF742 domain-containing protein [Amycolatopsis xylanica]SDX05323.1 Protein of unknown function [Amycolatopsis xylanica]